MSLKPAKTSLKTFAPNTNSSVTTPTYSLTGQPSMTVVVLTIIYGLLSRASFWPIFVGRVLPRMIRLDARHDLACTLRESESVGKFDSCEIGRDHLALSCNDPSLTPARIVRTGAFPLKAPSVKKEPSLLVKSSPTSTLPKLVSAMTFAAVDAGISISTPLKPASTFASASRESVPPKSSSYPAAPPERRISEKLALARFSALYSLRRSRPRATPWIGGWERRSRARTCPPLA